MTLRAHHESLKGSRSSTFSPPAWKDQLKQRCMQRLQQDRHALLAKLRSPDATRSVADEMKRLVFREEQQLPLPLQQTHRHPVFNLQQHDYDTDDTDIEDHEMASAVNRTSTGTEAYASIEELVAAGELSESEYLELVHALEDELLADATATDNGEQLVEQMVEYEEASLDAMLAGLDLSVPDDFFDDEFEIASHTSSYERAAAAATAVVPTTVPCPVCSTGTVYEVATHCYPRLACACGFALQTTHESLHGALQDFHETVSAAYVAHREQCVADPTFSVAQGTAAGGDAMRIECRACCTSELLP